MKNTKSFKVKITVRRKKKLTRLIDYSTITYLLYIHYIGANDEYLIIILSVTQYDMKYNALLTEIMVCTTNTRSSIISSTYYKTIPGRDTAGSKHISEYKRNINNSV